jgi:hypothetical protein
VTARIRVRLTPRGGADRIEGVIDGVLRVRVAAAPTEGAANEALCRLLARELGVPPSGVRIVSGATSRTKVVALEGTTDADLRERWPDLG